MMNKLYIYKIGKGHFVMHLGSARHRPNTKFIFTLQKTLQYLKKNKNEVLQKLTLTDLATKNFHLLAKYVTSI